MTTESTQKQLKILAAMTRIHHSIGANLELEEVSRIVVQELVEILECAGCAMLLIEGDKVRLLAQRGFSKMLGEKEFSADMPAIKHIVETGECVCTGDIENSPAVGCVPAGCSMKSLICAPVVVQGAVQGILHLDSPMKDAFEAEDIHFVRRLAEEISIAVERSWLHTQVKFLSVKDGLTGCYNRRKLDQDLNAEIARARRYERALSLLMIDIDRFKDYNDVHGHVRGDELLRKMVSLFMRNVRASDNVYRYGGEEFVVLLPETSKERAILVARKLQKLVAAERFEGEQEKRSDHSATVSIGVASFPWDGNSKEELLTSADSELYRAKRSGRNTVCAVDVGAGLCQSGSAGQESLKSNIS